MTVEYVFTGLKGGAVASSVQAPFVPLLDKPPHLTSILPVKFVVSPRCKSFASVLALGCSLNALGQAEKPSLATTAMKAVADQVEEDWADGRWNQADVGPFMSAAMHTPQGRTLKGIAIKVGDTAQAGREAVALRDARHPGLAAADQAVGTPGARLGLEGAGVVEHDGLLRGGCARG